MISIILTASWPPTSPDVSPATGLTMRRPLSPSPGAARSTQGESGAWHHQCPCVVDGGPPDDPED